MTCGSWIASREATSLKTPHDRDVTCGTYQKVAISGTAVALGARTRQQPIRSRAKQAAAFQPFFPHNSTEPVQGLLPAHRLHCTGSQIIVLLITSCIFSPLFPCRVQYLSLSIGP